MESEAKLSCSSLWKLYGSDPRGFFEKHEGNPSHEDTNANGYISAVRDVTIEVLPGEIVVVMGLSVSGKSLPTTPTTLTSVKNRAAREQ